MLQKWHLLVFTLLFCIVVNCKPKGNTPSTIEEATLYSKTMNRNVKLWAYLPPNYQSNKKGGYNVIFMHDGQNLFYDSLSFVGEWHVDESLDSLYHQTGKQIIVIGIEHGGDKRLSELTPYTHKKYGGGDGEEYLTFVTNQLIPFAEKHWNISKERKNRAIWGSSLGGLISYYAAFTTNEFSKYGIYSPSFWYSDSIFTLTKQNNLPEETKMLMTIGMKEENEHLNVVKMDSLLRNTQNIKLDTEIVKDGEHAEWFWGREFYDDVNWLFEK